MFNDSKKLSIENLNIEHLKIFLKMNKFNPFDNAVRDAHKNNCGPERYSSIESGTMNEMRRNR